MGPAVVTAVGVGLLVALQTALLSRAALRIPPLVAALLVNLGGLLAAGAWTVLRGRAADVLAGAAGWWWLLAGGAGWLIVGGLAAISARLGVAAALALVVASQVLGGLVFDARSGVAPLDLRALAGAALMVVGVWLLAGRAA